MCPLWALETGHYLFLTLPGLGQSVKCPGVSIFGVFLTRVWYSRSDNEAIRSFLCFCQSTNQCGARTMSISQSA